ncbi:EndoU domain-containing protein [Listeria goaensis]|uniref:EndoU domain-containing protein n=1 Tax=Listeria goaensis TaxID=1649188 RepID=UPI000B5964EA|nr:EndoU domain-containing protein [Listeria goaensis]
MSRISIAEVRAFQEALQKANATMRARIQAVQASAFRYSADYFLDGQAIQASQYYFRETYQTVGGSLLEILDTSEALLERYLNDFSAQVDDSKTAKVNAELLGVAVEKAQRIRQKQEKLQHSLSSQTGPSQEGRVQQLRLDLVEAVEEEKILENYLQFEQSHTHFFQELLALVMTAQRTMRQLLQEVEFNAQTGTYTYPKGYTQSMDALKQRLNTVRGVDPKRVEALKAYQVLAVVYYDAEGKPQVMWLLEQNGVGVNDPKLKKYLDKAGKYLDPSDYQIITNEELNKKITESWKTGTYYMDGTQYTGMAGGTLRASAYVESVKGTLDESGLMDVVMGLGLSTAAIRGSMTYEGAKVEIPEQSLKHADIGDFTVNPSTGKVSKMKGGGHGQSNIDFLKENGFEVNIEKTYPNGVRIGNVPDHKVRAKRTGNNQSWFPENWINKDIESAGQHVASQPNFASVKDGEAIFGEFNGVRVGVIKTDGKPATIFPDAIKQP